MLSVSNDYRKALNEKVRDIKAQVEIGGGYAVYNEALYEKFDEYNNATGDMQDEDETKRILDYQNFLYKYASLEQDYTILDGSFILPNRSDNKYRGYIGNIGTSDFKIETITSPTAFVYGYNIRLGNQITIYFEGGYPGNLQIKYKYVYRQSSSETTSISEEQTLNLTCDSEIKTIDIPTEIPTGYYFDGYKSFEIITSNWSVSNRRHRIRHIVNGQPLLYEGEDVISIKLLEQTDIYNENLPSNELNVEIGNYDKKFNPFDIQNIYNNFDLNTIINANIGINTDNGYEYINLGQYRFGSYEVDKNKIAKINCKGAVDTMLNTDYQYLYNSSENINYIPRYIGIARYNFLITGVVDMQSSNYNSYREQAQALGIYTNTFIKQDKDREKYTTGNLNEQSIYDYSLSYNQIDKNNIIEINKNQEISFPEVKNREKIKTITFNYIKKNGLESNYSVIFEDEVYNTEYNSQNNRWESIIDIKTSSPHTSNSNQVRYTIDGNVVSRSANMNEYELKYINYSSSENPQQVKIETYNYKYTEQKNILINQNISTGVAIEYNGNFFYDKAHQRRISNYIFSIDKQYEFSLEILGDISLEVGDVISFETQYGNKMYGIIQSIDTTYNGGLTQIIKGVCSDVL